MINNIKEKIREFSRIIKRYPNIKEFYIERAKLYGEIKEYKKAFEDFKKTLDEYYTCEDIATVCEKVGLKKEAENFYTKAINENKNNPNAYINRIYFYMRTGETEKAISDCKTVLKISPKDENISTLKQILTKK